MVISSAILVSISSAGEPSRAADRNLISQSTQSDTTDALQPFPENPNGRPLWYAMVTNVPGDWVKYCDITFRNDKIVQYSVIAAMTGILMAVDHPTYQTQKEWTKNSKTLDYWSGFFTDVGQGDAQLGLAAAYTVYGLAVDDNRSLRTASETVQALLAGGAVVQLIKHVTGRESPYTATSPTGIWRFFPNQFSYAKNTPNYDAFPTGHLCTSISTVVVIAENYPEMKWIRPVGYTIVAAIGVSMVNIGIHWYSDYPLGLALGYTFGMIAAHPEGYDVANFGKDNSDALTLQPTLMPGGAGITMSLNLH
ncbi:MAG: phosphatase PAP2 family protein [Bacteroidota bacterium]